MIGIAGDVEGCQLGGSVPLLLNQKRGWDLVFKYVL